MHGTFRWGFQVLGYIIIDSNICHQGSTGGTLSSPPYNVKTYGSMTNMCYFCIISNKFMILTCSHKVWLFHISLIPYRWINLFFLYMYLLYNIWLMLSRNTGNVKFFLTTFPHSQKPKFLQLGQWPCEQITVPKKVWYSNRKG